MQKNFIFIYGNDDYLVNQEGMKLYNEHTSLLLSDFSKEVLDGSVQNVGELETLVSHLRQSIQTISLFGEKKVIWLKMVNFLGDSVTSKAESAKVLVADIQALCEKIDLKSTQLIISASPVDKRTKEFKWFQQHGDAIGLDSLENQSMVVEYIQNECKALGSMIDFTAAELLAAKVKGSTRLILEEVQKLSTYTRDTQAMISKQMVLDLVPDFGEGDFFEFAEAFFAHDLNWSLRALKNYFFIHKEPRPLITTLQNRNRLLIQLKALVDADYLELGAYGFQKKALDNLQALYKDRFGDFEEKSTYNVITQNAWYLGKLASQSLRQYSLKKLIGHQKEFLKCFQAIVSEPTEAQMHMETMVIRCLS